MNGRMDEWMMNEWRDQDQDEGGVGGGRGDGDGDGGQRGELVS